MVELNLSPTPLGEIPAVNIVLNTHNIILSNQEIAQLVNKAGVRLRERSQKKINIFLATFSIISDEHLPNTENSVRFVIHTLGPFPHHDLLLGRDDPALQLQVRPECNKVLRYVLITAWGNCNREILSLFVGLGVFN